MTTRDISDSIAEMCGANVSHRLISQVTNAIQDEVTRWQNRPLDEVYLVFYLDGIVVKVHKESRVVRKTVYLALGITAEGCKEPLRLWIAETEGAWGEKFPSIGKPTGNLTTFLALPDDIRKVIYTTNAIELLNSVDQKDDTPAENLPERDVGEDFLSGD